MSLRNCYWLLFALVLAGSSGCCCWDWGVAGSPCERTWCCSQCGPVFWNEWFSIPPRCCDDCDNCGEFTGSDNPYVESGPTETRFGELYSDGSGRGRTASRPSDEYYTEPPRSAPSRSAPPRSAPPRGAPPRTAPRGEPTPAEELPPAESTTSLGMDEFGQTASYHRQAPRYREYRPEWSEEQASYDEPIDSPGNYRKLGRPHRSARYAR